MSAENRFRIAGLDRIKFAVTQLEEARRFATDWGLAAIESGAARSCSFSSADGSEVEIVAADEADPERRPIGSPSGVCEITWGVTDPAALPDLAHELRKDRHVAVDAEGALHTHDDIGLRLCFRPMRRRATPCEPTRFNAPGQPARMNARGPRYERATPHEISHLAIGVDDAAQAAKFYVERLGFLVSDRYANRGMFLRCAPTGNHHHLFLMNGRVPGTRFNHLAFKVRDIHEVIGGGQRLNALGWKTFAGPGRHVVSSACFWYFQTPFGGAWEYAADEDVVCEDWNATDFAATAHIFSEWTFGLEESDGTLRGPISQSRERS